MSVFKPLLEVFCYGSLRKLINSLQAAGFWSFRHDNLLCTGLVRQHSVVEKVG